MGRSRKRQHEDDGADEKPRLSKKQKMKLKKQQHLEKMIEEFKNTTSPDPCPLCGHGNAPYLAYGHDRPYYQCTRCEMIFIPHNFRIPVSEEAALYQRHEKDAEDEGFKKFTSQLTQPLVKALQTRGSTPEDATSLEAQLTNAHVTGEEPWAKIGLDYGSGPGPAIGPMLEHQGFNIIEYDPYAFPTPVLETAVEDAIQAEPPAEALACVADKDLITPSTSTSAFEENFSKLPEALRTQYAFITLTEVLKNVRNPLFVWQHLYSLLRKGGVLAILGAVCVDASKFDTWHYHRDKSHIVFYTPKTLEYVAKLFSWKLVKTLNSNVYFFVKE